LEFQWGSNTPIDKTFPFADGSCRCGQLQESSTERKTGTQRA
jgi:hypothetical protein